MTEEQNRAADELQPNLADLEERAAVFSQLHLGGRHDALLKSFADVIHTSYSLQRFFQVCVSIPVALGRLHGRFYLYGKNNLLQCVCDSRYGFFEHPQPAEDNIIPAVEPYEAENKWIYPLFPDSGGEHELAEKGYAADTVPDNSPAGDAVGPDPYFSRHSLLGAFVVFPLDAMTDEDRQLFEILSSWMGHKLNNRLIADRHIEHLRFLNALGRDIGHNVIIPNMYLKYLFRKLEKQIISLKGIEEKGLQLAQQCQKPELCQELVNDCIREQKELENCHEELIKHHNQISMFLESLFRQEHFTRGHLVVQPKKTYVERDIIIPQLEMYADRLARQGITIDKPQNMYEQEYPLMVDVGLLSQVYANLFSNAVKYTQEIIDHQGRPRKAVAYGSEEIHDFPEPGMKGIKFNVFTTGKPLSNEELSVVFQEGGRAGNAEGIRGSGHGLDFIRRVIEVHGGKVGCEPSEQGNNFYFILPLSRERA